MYKALTFMLAFTMVLSISACGGKTAAPEVEPPAPVDQPAGAKTAPPPPTDQPDGAKTAPPDENGVEFEAEAGAKLVVWESKGKRAYSDEFIKEFTDRYGVEVTWEEVDPAEQADRLAQDRSSAADVVMLPNTDLGKAVEAGLVLPNDQFEVESRSMNAEAAVQGASYKGILYGYPLAAETYLLYYNKDLIQEAPKTFEDVIEFSKKFTDKTNKKYGVMWEVGDLYFSYPFLASSGGYIYGKGGTDVNDIGLNSAEAQKSMEVFASLKEALPVKSDKITKEFKSSLFTSGNLAMDIYGSSVLGEYKEALGDKLGVAPLPTIGGQPATSFSDIKAWYVSANTPYPNAARMFAYYASTKDAQLQYSAQTGAAPTNKEAQESDQIKSDPYLSAFAAQLGSSEPVPSLPEMDNVWEPVGAALVDIWDNNKDMKVSLDHAVKQIQEQNSATIDK